MSSRRIKQDEQTQLTEQFSKVNEFPIALDALAIIAHPDLPLEQLSIVQIGKIFSAEISNWNQLGGPDQAIQLFSRDHNSGTWDTFKNLVLKPADKKLSPDSARLESSQALVDRVNTTPGAIGFVGVAYTEKSKLLKVTAEENEEGSTPSRYTIGTQNYPLSRKLYLYTTGEDTSILGKEFIEFVTTNAGQKLAEKTGLISYYPTRSQPDKLDKFSPPRYRELSAMANRISVDFAANLNHADLAKEERDIQRLLNFVKQNQHRKIVLVDFVSSPRIIDLASRLNQQGIPVLDTMQLTNDKAEHRNIEVWVL